jgi:hypothetical protein
MAVSPDTRVFGLDQTLVDDMNLHLDQLVASGDITQAERNRVNLGYGASGGWQFHHHHVHLSYSRLSDGPREFIVGEGDFMESMVSRGSTRINGRGGWLRLHRTRTSSSHGSTRRWRFPPSLRRRGFSSGRVLARRRLMVKVARLSDEPHELGDSTCGKPRTRRPPKMGWRLSRPLARSSDSVGVQSVDERAARDPQGPRSLCLVTTVLFERF